MIILLRASDFILLTHLSAIGFKFGDATVVLTGINTDTCVYSTAFSTANRLYKTVVISDCTASMRGKDSHEMALELMSRSFAWVLPLAEFKAKVLAGVQAGM